MEHEVDILSRVKEGESDAFGLLYDHYFDAIYRFIYFKTFSREITEDLTSDTFFKALNRIGSFNAS